MKWPGGKRWLAPSIRASLPRGTGRYHEPFAGGAAAFFSFLPQESFLSDSNRELIAAYKQVAHNAEDLIQHLSSLKNDEATYYSVRADQPKTELASAVRFLYLSRLSFNGIYRVNLQGKFNVPYGYKTHMTVCDPQHIRACSSALRRTVLSSVDYREAMSLVRAEDTVFIDPPYTSAHNNNGFIKYNEHLFSWQDQVELAHQAKASADAGALVIVTNAAHDALQLLYPTFFRIELRRYSSVSAKDYGRSRVEERLYAAGHGAQEFVERLTKECQSRGLWEGTCDPVA